MACRKGVGTAGGTEAADDEEANAEHHRKPNKAVSSKKQAGPLISSDLSVSEDSANERLHPLARHVLSSGEISWNRLWFMINIIY